MHILRERVMINTEIWKDIQGFDGLYQVSNLGRIKSSIRSRILEGSLNKEGYRRITLRSSGTGRPYYVHRLVAETFLPNPDNLPQVDHINTIRDDNRIENLRWVTPSKNNNNKLTRKRNKKAQIELTAFKRLIIQLNMDNSFVAIFYYASDASKSTGIHSRAILKCCNGIQNSAGGYIWMFYNME